MLLLCMNCLFKCELGDFIHVNYKCVKNDIFLRYYGRFLNYVLIELALNNLKIIDLEAAEVFVPL
jgi:hypothetical protein